MGFIQIDGLEKFYSNSGLVAIKNLNLSVEKGEFVSIVGPFGCGKTTLLHLLGGITDNYKGSILINGDVPSQAKKKRNIGYGFQKPNLLPWLDVLDNIVLPQRIAGVNVDNAKAMNLLDMVGLNYCSHMKSYNLSGGMQQLVSIVRGLILDPEILLLDEPLSSVDEITRSALQVKLLEIHTKTDKTTVMVTHSISEAVLLSDKVVVLTSRPAQVKKVVEIVLSQRNEEVLFSTKFQNYLKLIKEELRNG